MIKEFQLKYLERTRDLLANSGWIQNGWRSLDGFCCIGAIHQAAREIPVPADPLHVSHEVIEEISKSISEKYGMEGIIMFNDYPGRTQEDVLDILDGTISRVKAEYDAQSTSKNDQRECVMSTL